MTARAEAALQQDQYEEKRMTHAIDASPKFVAMTIPQQGLYIVKLAIFLVTMGFAFPRLLSD
jgi:hypothetical protein